MFSCLFMVVVVFHMAAIGFYTSSFAIGPLPPKPLPQSISGRMMPFERSPDVVRWAPLR